MNLLLIVIPVLSFILFGFIVATIIPFKFFVAVSSDYLKQELSFAILTFLILPVLIIGLLINYQLDANLNSDYHNIIRVGGVLNLYLYIVTPGFLALGILAKLVKKEGYSLLFWGSLFLAFTMPVILLIFGFPVCELFTKIFWNENITVRKIIFH